MKVLIAIPCLKRGGTEMQTLLLVKALINCKHTVYTICYFENDQTVIEEYEEHGSKVKLLNLSRDISPIKLIFILKGEFKKITPDVVHVQYLAPGALPIIAARFANIKTIFATVHQPYTKKYHGIKAKIILRIAAFFCTHFIAVSKNAEKSWFNKICPFDPLLPKFHKHFTIYNAIDIVKINITAQASDNSSIKSSLGLQNKLIIGAVSRLSYEKGIDVLIKAFKMVSSISEDIHLVIVGDGKEKPVLENLTNELNIAQRVHFLGKKTWEETVNIMNIMDIVVCASRFEGFGLTAAEAMALKKPVVVSRVGGLLEVSGTGLSPLQFSTENSHELAQVLTDLIEQGTVLYTKYGEIGYQRVKDLFSFDVFERSIQHLYFRYLK